MITGIIEAAGGHAREQEVTVLSDLQPVSRYISANDGTVTHRYAMEAVSKLELSGILYPPCPTTFGNTLPQGAALAPGAGGADAAQLAAMQVRAHAPTCCVVSVKPLPG